jgi:hypothetical protein
MLAIMVAAAKQKDGVFMRGNFEISATTSLKRLFGHDCSPFSPV